MEYVNEARLRETLAADAAAFRSARPFPHLAVEGFLHDHVARALEAEFPRVDHTLWKHHLHLNSHKFACNRLDAMPPLFQAVLRELNSPPVLRHLEALTGIDDLLPDDGLEGGGLHQSVRGGFLEIHADFNYHPVTRLHRRLNLLVYLNREWDPAWDGDLELWSSDMSRRVRSITPVLNRAVLFATTDVAYHGHPRPLAAPPGVTRKSLALYYYTRVRPEAETTRPHSTLYRHTRSSAPAASRLKTLARSVFSHSGLRAVRTALLKLFS